MLGYFSWVPEGRPQVRVGQRQIGGARFCCVTVCGGGRRVERRVRRVIKKLQGQGLRQCVAEAGWPDGWRAGVRAVDDLALRRKLLAQLLDRLCTQRAVTLAGAAALLSAPSDSEEVWQAAELLARRSRYLVLALPDAARLRQMLWRRYGLSSAVSAPCPPAIQVCFDLPKLPVPALLLGPEATRRQKVSYQLAPPWEERLAPWRVSPELVAALWESAVLPAEEIRVNSLGTNA